MKKLISIILIVILSLSAFSCVSCFADIKGRVGPEYVLIPEEKIPNFLGDLAITIDHKCSTKDWEESYKEYAERMSSSDKTEICIFRNLFYFLDILNQIKYKVKIVNIMDKALTDQFNLYYQNAINENIELTNSDLIEIKTAYQAFPNRFLKVLVKFLEIFDRI